jgi:hypothetical protein
MVSTATVEGSGPIDGFKRLQPYARIGIHFTQRANLSRHVDHSSEVAKGGRSGPSALAHRLHRDIRLDANGEQPTLDTRLSFWPSDRHGRQ